MPGRTPQVAVIAGLLMAAAPASAADLYGLTDDGHRVSDRRALTVTVTDDPEQSLTDARLLRRRVRLRRVLRIPVACYDPCKVRARLRLLLGRGPAVGLHPWLARGTLTAERRGRLRLRLSRKELRRLRAAAPERVVLRLAVSNSAGNTSIRLVRVTLLRG